MINVSFARTIKNLLVSRNIAFTFSLLAQLFICIIFHSMFFQLFYFCVHKNLMDLCNIHEFYLQITLDRSWDGKICFFLGDFVDIKCRISKFAFSEICSGFRLSTLINVSSNFNSRKANFDRQNFQSFFSHYPKGN